VQPPSGGCELKPCTVHIPWWSGCELKPEQHLHHQRHGHAAAFGRLLAETDTI